jgi:hypothetical protein
MILRETLAYNFANEGCPAGTRCALWVDEEDGESHGVVRLR